MKKPAIRINHFWKSRPFREEGKGNARRLIVASKRLVGSFEIVMVSKFLIGADGLFKRARFLAAHTLIFISAMEALNKGIEVRSLGRTEIDLNPHAK